ncbi:recombinase family protein [Streptomyces sp. C184]|uniref:recombinase family protein n=1 Tax=Streptomyces sp. C184 TaxID=3237121 RepID=UPI0034C63615
MSAGHIIGWADDWEVSGATDPVTRPKLGPWLRDAGPYDGLVAAAVDRLGRNVVDCLNIGYKMRDEGKLLVTYGHEGPWDLTTPPTRTASPWRRGAPRWSCAPFSAGIEAPPSRRALPDAPRGNPRTASATSGW